MVAEKHQILSKIKEVVQLLDNRAIPILYGSHARGDTNSESDWDLLILVDGAVNLEREHRFRHTLFEVELELGVAISVILTSKNNWDKKTEIIPLFQNIRKEGIRL